MMSGLSLSAIQGYEQGRYEPKRKSLESIAEVFKIPVDELYDMPAQLSTNLAEVGKDLISRQAAIDALVAETIYTKEELKEYYEANSHRNEWVNGIYESIETVKQLPPIQPKRGRWIEDKGQQTLMQNFIERGEVWRVCSVCGAGHMIGHKYAIDKAYHDRHHNFCPNCGADMREVTT